MTLFPKTLILAGALLALGAGAAVAGDVTVTLTGVRADQGPLLATLQTQGQFLQSAGAHGDMIAHPGAGAQTMTFRNVAPGEYSLSVLQDANGDQQMAFGPDGRPTEGWAMLNGAALRATPRFEQVSFTVPAQGDVVLTTPMIYPR